MTPPATAPATRAWAGAAPLPTAEPAAEPDRLDDKPVLDLTGVQAPNESRTGGGSTGVHRRAATPPSGGLREGVRPGPQNGGPVHRQRDHSRTEPVARGRSAGRITSGSRTPTTGWHPAAESVGAGSTRGVPVHSGAMSCMHFAGTAAFPRIRSPDGTRLPGHRRERTASARAAACCHTHHASHAHSEASDHPGCSTRARRNSPAESATDRPQPDQLPRTTTTPDGPAHVPSRCSSRTREAHRCAAAAASRWKVRPVTVNSNGGRRYAQQGLRLRAGRSDRPPPRQGRGWRRPSA